MTLLMNKRTNIVIDDGWVQLLAKTLPTLVNNFWWNIVMDDWKMDAKHLVSDNICKNIIYNPLKHLERMTNDVGITFGVGDTIPLFTTSTKKDN